MPFISYFPAIGFNLKKKKSDHSITNSRLYFLEWFTVSKSNSIIKITWTTTLRRTFLQLYQPMRTVASVHVDTSHRALSHVEYRLERTIRRHNVRLILAQCLRASICCNQTGYYHYTSFARHSFLIKLLPQIQRRWQQTLFLLINRISLVFVSSICWGWMPLICPTRNYRHFLRVCAAKMKRVPF